MANSGNWLAELRQQTAVTIDALTAVQELEREIRHLADLYWERTGGAAGASNVQKIRAYLASTGLYADPNEPLQTTLGIFPNDAVRTLGIFIEMRESISQNDWRTLYNISI